jgi:hypothetical protein
MAITRNTQPFAEAIAALRRRTANLVPTQRWDDLQREAHDRAFVVAGAMQADLLADFAKATDDAIAKGLGLQWFQGEFDKIVAKYGWEYNGTRNWRSRVIFQTNMLSSYAAGRLSQLRDPDLLKLKPFWMYKHSDAVANPRPLHVSWDGLTLPADHDWFRTHYPPNGWGCRCRIVAVSEAEARRAGGRFGPIPDNGTDANGVPVGIDPGWDYMPGDSADDAGATLAQQVASLPSAIGAPLQKQVQSQLPPYVPADLTAYIAAGKRLVDAIARPYLAADPLKAQERLLKALTARRPMGGGTATGSKPALALWRDAAARYPRDWNDVAAQAKPALKVSMVRKGGRASYSPSTGKLTLRDLSIAVHEYGHRLQFTVPGLDDWFEALHKRRTDSDALRSLRKLTGHNYRADEVARPDKYLSPYFGKEYGEGKALEVLTMTFQYLLGGNPRQFEDLLNGDRELANLAMGLLWYWKP